MEESPARAPWPLRLLLALSVILLLLAGAAELMRSGVSVAGTPTPEAPGPLDERIVPGHRVSFILLGLPITEVEGKLGAGVIRPSQDALLYLFEKVGLGCGVQKGQVVSIRVLSPHFRTRGGVGVGTDVDQVVRELGPDYEYSGDGPSPTPGAAPPESYVLHYWSQGIHVGVKMTRVESLQITAPVEGGLP